jgi:hypothetical protein
VGVGVVAGFLQVREREAKNPRFSFLDPQDLYYRYYRSLFPPKVSHTLTDVCLSSLLRVADDPR